MLYLISGVSYWIDIVLVVLLGFALIGSLYWDKLKVLIVLLTSVFIIGCGAYSIYNLYHYYTAEGGTIGIIQTQDKNNVYVDNMSFDFENVVFYATGAENEYEAKFVTEKTFKLDNTKYCELLVNGMPCDYVVNSSDYLIAEYNYNFYDEDLDVTINDKLTFHMSFYNNSSLLLVTTNGGENAVSKWNYFFNVNKFIVTIKQVDSVYISDSISNIDEYSTLSLYANEQLYSKVLVKNGKTYTLPTEFKIDAYKFYGWELDGEAITEITVTKDISISANVVKLYTVTFIDNDVVVKTIVVEDGTKIYKVDEPTPSATNMTFRGFYTSDGTYIDSINGLTVTTDLQFIASYSDNIDDLHPDDNNDEDNDPNQPNNGRSIG